MYKYIMNSVSKIFLFFVLLFASSISSAASELVFLNWSEYTDPVLVKEFEEKYQTKIKFIYFETDETRDDLLVQTEGEGYDLILVNGPSINKYFKRGWLNPVTEKEVPNLKYIEKKWMRLFTKAEGYSVPYFWGTTGIVYRKDLVKKEINSWKDLFQPEKQHHGKIAMIRSSIDTVSLALKSLNYSANSSSRKELKEAQDLLIAQKPFVKDYSYISISEKSSLISGDVHMSIAYSGDALSLKELDDNIEYVLPEEGGMIWIDSIAVSSHSKNKEMAYKFINFMNSPEIAKRNAEYTYCASPNTAAKKLLDKEMLSNVAIYPPEQALAKSETYGELKPRINRLRNQIFSDLIE